MTEADEGGIMYQTMVYDNITMYSAVDDTTMSTTPSNSAGGGGASKTVMNVIVITMYSIIFLLAVIGNSLVIVTLIQNKRMRSVTNVFLFSLSVSDLMFICVCLPFTLVGNLIHNFIFGPVMCKLISYTMTVSVSVSVWTMVAIALERYHAICNPLASRAWQTKSRAFKIVALVWFVSLICGLPDLIYPKLILHDKENMKYKCRHAWGPVMEYIHPFYLFIAFMVLPVMCLFFAYGLIILELWRGIVSEKRATAKEKEENGTPMKDLRTSATTMSPDSNANDPFLKNNSKAIYRPQSGKVATRNMGPVRSTSSNNAKKRVVRMLIVLVLLFFIAWTPTWILNMWYVVNRARALKLVRRFPHMLLVIRLMSYASACVNPIVYCFMNRSFRNGFLEVFKCCTGPVKGDVKPTVGSATTHRTRMHHPPDSTTNYTNVSSGEED
ncbi:putative cholecystokinin receptor type A [Apostichopus japonicus]|uniref:Gastrin/cholecystokinin type B receptor n=1 Tax=Stichopus japonicus TaxID=307972 RepID=A0A2G8KL37_STIJA|nr:putative cholecystokinin receptor type A [Apostichopus japonicus]